MTADRREYGRNNKSFPDTTLPPPQMPDSQFPPPHMAEPYYEPEPYFNSYEPTQDLQWGKMINFQMVFKYPLLFHILIHSFIQKIQIGPLQIT